MSNSMNTKIVQKESKFIQRQASGLPYSDFT